ncbi:hypothetical protein [Halosimplex pelagicum]|uniref:DUF8108 domain-containing protein n=1 Tax=Halosimplex pelagicum TaxID=869886 RepID=A0A7D5TIR9_9EURY|nr:hypothetical protein [Halosimplex pelagicum]QLH84176.1 hypothetical protein HZS54_22180 [Halosimplex pelagicum]
MADDGGSLVSLADEVSALLNGVAGWLLVWLGLTGVAVVAARAAGGTLFSLPPALVVLALSVVAVVAGVAVNPRFERSYARSRFGRVPAVERRTVRPSEAVDEPCVVCGETVDRGLCRRYREEFVVAGLALTATDGEENYYCLDCAATELGIDTDPVDESTADRETDGERLAESE